MWLVDLTYSPIYYLSVAKIIHWSLLPDSFPLIGSKLRWRTDSHISISGVLKYKENLHLRIDKTE